MNPELTIYSEKIDFMFLGEMGNRLFLSQHHPDSQKETNDSFVIILLNPIFEERSRAQRYLYNWSCFLASQGHTVIRFDYRGTGDSDGHSKEISLQTQIDDLNRIYDWVKKQHRTKRIAFHGLRWGASLAAIVSNEFKGKIHHLVLWEPLKDGRNYFMTELRKNLASQLIVHNKVIVDRKQLIAQLENGETINIDGYIVGPGFLKEIDRVNLKEFSYKIPTLQYKFLKSIPSGIADNKTFEQNSNLTMIGSVQPHFFIEVKEYTNQNINLFSNCLEWMDSLD